MFSTSHLVSKLSKHIDKHIEKFLPHGDRNVKPQDSVQLLHVDPQIKSNISTDCMCIPEHEFKIFHVEELGNVRSLTTRVERDLGFQGQLGRYVLLTYGDTMYRDKDWSEKFIGMTCNSIGMATDDPTKVHDPLLNDSNHPQYFLEPAAEYGENTAEHALGITNIIEISPGRGILYYLLNHRPNGQQRLLGSGIADVVLNFDAVGNAVPEARRLCRWWWDAEEEPNYGDICSLRHNDHIYAYGHMKDNPWIYLTRVHISHALNVNMYEYWNGSTWQNERLNGPALGEKEAVFWKIQQGQIFWSGYHRRFLFIYCDAWWTDQILVKTATEPQGPWSEPVTIYKAKLASDKGCIYSPVPHPYFDNTGKTLVITYTNMPNIIQTIKVFFE